MYATQSAKTKTALEKRVGQGANFLGFGVTIKMDSRAI